MRINGLLAAAWQLLQPLVSSSKAAANLVLLFALTAFSTSSIRGSMMVLIISATGKPSKVGKSLAASSSVPLLTDDSQIGANLQVCADEEDRADIDQHS